MKRLAIIDVSKSGGNPLLNLPEGTETIKDGNRWIITYQDHTLILRLQWENASRWVAVASIPGGKVAQKVWNWVQNRLGAKIAEMTYAFCEANEASLAAIGVFSEMREGVKVYKVHHVICGGSPYIYPPDSP